MSAAAEILRDAADRGVELVADGDHVRVRFRGAPPDDLLDRLREHRDAVLAALRCSPAPKALISGGERLSATPDAPAPPRTWLLLPPGSTGEMRLAVAAEPPWPPMVHVAARLVGRIDALHRAGRDREAEGAAISLEGLLAELGREGIQAWMTS